jgi:cytochrome P450
MNITHLQNRLRDKYELGRNRKAGCFWSITRFEDIKTVDTNHKIFLSDGAIAIGLVNDDFNPPNFIAMDQPKHDVQRKVVTPTASPSNLSKLESIIRDKAALILDGLPIGETFDWVDKVSEVVGEVKRLPSNFVPGITEMPVRLHAL